jgi:hypothetical protein
LSNLSVFRFDRLSVQFTSKPNVESRYYLKAHVEQLTRQEELPSTLVITVNSSRARTTRARSVSRTERPYNNGYFIEGLEPSSLSNSNSTRRMRGGAWETVSIRYSSSPLLPLQRPRVIAVLIHTVCVVYFRPSLPPWQTYPSPLERIYLVRLECAGGGEKLNYAIVIPSTDTYTQQSSSRRCMLESPTTMQAIAERSSP